MTIFSEEEFRELVLAGFLSLPERVRERIENVALLVEKKPTRAMQKEQNLSKNETLLGLYVGIPLSERGSGYGALGDLPDTIYIFQEPIEEVAEGDQERIRALVAETVYHEYAHHFGMDEEEVEEWERKNRNN